MATIAYPVGRCYCGCGAALVDPRGFFLPGHDKRAEARIIRDRYGSVANFALAHGYGPHGSPFAIGVRVRRKSDGAIRTITNVTNGGALFVDAGQKTGAGPLPATDFELIDD